MLQYCAVIWLVSTAVNSVRKLIRTPGTTESERAVSNALQASATMLILPLAFKAVK